MLLDGLSQDLSAPDGNNIQVACHRRHGGETFLAGRFVAQEELLDKLYQALTV